jgi:hypothetical protein
MVDELTKSHKNTNYSYYINMIALSMGFITSIMWIILLAGQLVKSSKNGRRIL